MYLVFDHSGTQKQITPFIHLPAWVQVEKGGWLSFHFVAWNASPVRYRDGSPEVPPSRPTRWEWTPEKFDMKRDGPWFDTFLVRHQQNPDHLLHPIRACTASITSAPGGCTGADCSRRPA